MQATWWVVGTGWADWDLGVVTVCCRCPGDKQEMKTKDGLDGSSNWPKFMKAGKCLFFSSCSENIENVAVLRFLSKSEHYCAFLIAAK